LLEYSLTWTLGWLPECRGALGVQYIQGGSDGDPIVAEFFVKYAPNKLTADLSFDWECCRFAERVAEMNVSAEALYTSLLADAENEPGNANVQGRLANLWNEYGS